MVYLNHAATTYPKPQTVLEAVARSIAEPPASQYRGAVPAQYSEDIMKLCRENLARLFHIGEPHRIYFTSGSTQSLNMAILGLRSRRRQIAFTAAEHNAVLRTIYHGRKREIEEGIIIPVMIPCDGSGYADMDMMRRAITEDTALVIVNHSSNVTGAVQDIAAVGRWAREAGALFLVDASQSAGALPIDVEKQQIDMLAFTGHKGLYGIQGSGGLYIREGTDMEPILFGGTGADSRTMIPETPFMEVGTANIPGIAGMNAGAAFVLEEGLEKIQAHERELMECLYQGLCECQGVQVYAHRQPGGTALSFNIKGLSPSDAGYILCGTYGITLRTGLHCAPAIHKYLGTQKQGTVRVSISYLTRRDEVECFLEAVRALSKQMGGRA